MDFETNMAPPTAKRVCMETVPDMPADPTTPIDDFDDLYEDSPVINNHREKSPQRSSVKITLQQSNPNLLATPFQLPGLGLFASKENNPEQEANGEKEQSLPHNATSLPPVGELPVAQNLLQTEGEPPPQLYETRKNHAHSTGQIDSPIVDDSNQSKGLDATSAPVFEVSPQAQTSTEEQQRVEGSKYEAISQIEGRCNTLEQPLIDQSATDIQTSQWAAGVAGEGPQENPEKIARSDALGVSEQDSPRQGDETKYVGASQTLTGEQDGNEIANEEPEIQNEDRNTLVPPPSTDSVRKDDTSDQGVDKLALHTLQDNIKADPHGDVDNLTALSDNSDFNQAAPSPQVDLEDATKAEKSRTFEEVATSNIGNGEAEFELDSSPIEPSSESGSESSSSSSSGESDYQMLDPAEEARRLMQEDGGSDDEGKGGKGSSGPLRTLNEKPDEIVPKPQVEITPEMTISELGRVEHVVENSILIKGKTSGESRALESGSLLCLGDRSIIGVIAELLGQVQQPYYSVRFTNPAAITEVGILKGTPIFYVEQHSSYIFTQSLKALKGSDASNIHDEEVGDDELEFSDDEAEAEHKRRAKQERQARRAGREDWNDGGARRGRTDMGGRNDRGGRGNRGDGYSRGPRRGHLQGEGRGHFHQTDSRDTSSPIMNYDDNDDGDDLYTPLARPPNLHEIMGRGEAPQESLNNHVNGIPGVQRFQRGGRSERGRGRGDRGRGDRGRGARGGRGDWGQRGGFNRDSRLEKYDSQGPQNHSQRPPSPRHNNNHPSFRPPFNAASAPSSHGWPNQMQLDHPSGSPIPSYQQPLYTLSQQTNHPSYPSNTYGQPQYPYPSLQDQSPQTYNPPQYTSYQTAAPPTSPVPSNIPAGAHINPAFFSPSAPQAWPQQQQQQNYGCNNNNTPSQPSGGEGNRTSQSQEAFQAAQERLDLLRQLTRSAAGSSSG
ncbi:MAG: hypothetical protein LQ339_001696 [Xanthoria mediterranea]|nr:MAG: hypothetical protein LQ339_001696 [Xanthoria mediterranea]